jgi:hypothetical protein
VDIFKVFRLLNIINTQKKKTFDMHGNTAGKYFSKVYHHHALKYLTVIRNGDILRKF